MRAHDGMRYRNTRPDTVSKRVPGEGLLRATSLKVDALSSPHVVVAPAHRRKSSAHTPPLASPRNIRDTISFAEVWAANQAPTPRDESVRSDDDDDGSSISQCPSHDVAYDDAKSATSWGSHVERHGNAVLQAQRKRTLRLEDHGDDDIVAGLGGRPLSATTYRAPWQQNDDASSARSDDNDDDRDADVADMANTDTRDMRKNVSDRQGRPERPMTATSALVRGLQRKLQASDHARGETPASVVRRRVEDVQANRCVAGGTGTVQEDIIIQAMEARRLQQPMGRDRSRSAPSIRKPTGSIGISGLRKQHEDEMEAIRHVFERQNLAFDAAVFERALFVPEDHVHEECVKRLPIAGSKLPENPLLARKMAIEKGLQRKKRSLKRRPRKKRTKKKKKKKKKTAA